MEKPISGQELFLKAFVINLIREFHNVSKNEYGLNEEVVEESAKQYIFKEIPLLKIPEGVLKRSYGNLVGHATSEHEEDSLGNKIRKIIKQRAPPLPPVQKSPDIENRARRITVPRPGSSRPMQNKTIGAPTNEGNVQIAATEEMSKEGAVEEEGYELTQIKFPRPVNVQEISSEGENNTMQVGALHMERMSPSKDLPAPTKVRSMQLEPIPQQPRPLQARPYPGGAQQLSRPPMQRPSTMQSGTMPRTAKPKQHPSILEELTIFGFAKLDELIQDPSIETIECPGPEKPILISRRGKVQPASFSLKSEEIDRIMREISDKTRIPLTTGIFRAALRRYLVTAVLSEFVGTRFIIQKKSGVE